MKYPSLRLCERATDDAAKFAEIDAILSAMVRHFRTGDKMHHYGLRLTKFQNREPVLTLRGQDIGLPSPHDRLWFCFEPIVQEQPTGLFNRTVPKNDPIIYVFCLDHPDESADVLYNPEDVAQKVVYDTQVRLVLLHELIHYFDSFRNPQISKTTTQGKPPSQYFNSGIEFNAFSNNIAEPLLRLITICKQNSTTPKLIRLYAQQHGITESFQDTVANLLERARQTSAIKHFLMYLNKRNQRALVRRLYTLHSEAIALLSAYDQ